MPGRRYKRKPGARKYIHYSSEILHKALNAVKGGMTLRKAEAVFGIPHATLARKNKQKHMKKVGRPTVFSCADETTIVEVITLCAAWGFPLTALDIRLIVKGHLDRRGVNEPRFKNNMPGRYWMEGFLFRHKEVLSTRLSENIKRARASVSPDSIKEYFKHLEKTTAGIESEAMVNYDETNISDDPGKKKVLIRRGSKHAANIIDSSKSSVSVMFAGTANGVLLPPYTVANGVLLPPYTVYKAEHVYDSWTESGPPGAVYNKTKSGWFDSVTFEHWFFKIIMPYFDSLGDKPKLLIDDNLSSHLSVPVIKACIAKNVKFACLPSNSTHLCQPLDLCFFRPLKLKWREILTEWKNKNRGCVTKDVFPRLLKRTLNEIKTIESNLKSGFKAAGIYPLNVNEVLKKLPSSDIAEENVGPEWAKSFQEFLRDNRMPQNTPARKKRTRVQAEPGQGFTSEDVQSLMNKKKKTSKKVKDTERKKTTKNKEQESEKRRKNTDSNREMDDIQTLDGEDLIQEMETIADVENLDVETETVENLDFEHLIDQTCENDPLSMPENDENDSNIENTLPSRAFIEMIYEDDSMTENETTTDEDEISLHDTSVDISENEDEDALTEIAVKKLHNADNKINEHKEFKENREISKELRKLATAQTTVNKDEDAITQIAVKTVHNEENKMSGHKETEENHEFSKESQNVATAQTNESRESFKLTEFVEVELVFDSIYNKTTKKQFKAQIIEVSQDKQSFKCKFLRLVNASKNIYAWPIVDDIFFSSKRPNNKKCKPRQLKERPLHFS